MRGTARFDDPERLALAEKLVDKWSSSKTGGPLMILVEFCDRAECSVDEGCVYVGRELLPRFPEHAFFPVSVLIEAAIDRRGEQCDR